jgi:excisionase family DNA binding protein
VLGSTVGEGGVSELLVDVRATLEAALAAPVVEAIEQLIAECVREALAAAAPTMPARRWLTLEEAAAALGCSPDAVRMRVARGTLEGRRQGRRLYVSARAVDELA